MLLVDTHQKVDELREAYLESCKHNDTTPDDLHYFREYVFQLIAMIMWPSEIPDPREFSK